MFLTGGNTETILISCFSNMKIYTRYVQQQQMTSLDCVAWFVLFG